jgi:hypothetical protein
VRGTQHLPEKAAGSASAVKVNFSPTSAGGDKDEKVRALIASCPTPSRRGRCPAPGTQSPLLDKDRGGRPAMKSPRQHCRASPKHERGTPRHQVARTTAEVAAAGSSGQ